MAAACKAACCVSFLIWILADFTAESLENVAPRGIASQSSTIHLGAASRAIDGNRDPENANSERINNAEILIGNSLENNGKNNPRCAVISSIPSGGTKTFNCTGMTGRMLTVKISTSYGILTMCELEMYGELAAPSPSVSAVVMGRRVAVVQKKLCWSDALLYCREHYWDLLSVRSEQEQRGLEEVLRNTTFMTNDPSVSSGHVWLGLRRRLMGSSWFWMSGASVSYTYWKEQHIWQVTSPCGGVDADDSYYWRNFPCGDHLYFVCLKEFEKNGNRVEFYSFTRQ
ncbi:uncharacterized protein LOC129378720 isoform X2 [Poeciliopsis prolifica]|uniref:uncharacterized protein LOC129378720 isoform X2 n=1 Tax=Poeciliopsis prolifica TaxID=188132 RepID=UPI002413E6A9|nr:uncharacterized protein LOC129378720 isoform X2 [Poeciliopsis prolifica]